MTKEPIDTPDDLLLTVGPAARLAAVTVQTLKAWIDDERLPAQRTATGVRLVRRSDLLAFLKLGASRGRRSTTAA
ncbi:MAG: helix-turn-helix domain-containing protein [Acidobacteria bacterium]|nr:helix-turn-helix domain-containing protein [Acidobacteriota bacterium]MCA1650794.1 helix-turn-helix domain-containing protein [Acidobacteriota bacterium]